jgi:hypothetical protein
MDRRPGYKIIHLFYPNDSKLSYTLKYRNYYRISDILSKLNKQGIDFFRVTQHKDFNDEDRKIRSISRLFKFRRDSLWYVGVELIDI